jgi:nucleoid DNA-binding protein
MTLTEIIGRMTEKLEMKGLDRNFFESAVSMVIDRIIEALAQGEDVKIRGLGTFRWSPVRARTVYLPHGEVEHNIPACYRLRFRPAVNLRSRPMADKEEGMTKLGVELDDDKVKQSSVDPNVPSTRRCPKCNQLLDDAGVCPEHGTEPLEKKVY